MVDIVPLDVPASAVLMQMANPLISRAIHAAATLSIADELATGTRSVEDLAVATGTHAPSLYRLLRALASVGIFTEHSDGRFGLTPLAQPLRSDAPDTVRPFLYVTGEVAGPAVAELEYSLRTGQPAFDHARGVSWWEYFAANPEAATIHDQMFVDQSNAIAPLLLEHCDLDGVDTVVDLGGGYGGLSLPLLTSYSSMRGVIVDLPHTAPGARDQIRAAGLEDRCQFVAGSFFESVPAGDLYLLKHVLRDWPDEDAERLLSRCADAAAPGGRLLIVDWLIGPPNEPDPAKVTDLFVMLVLLGGRDRTEDEFRSLLDAANADLHRITPLPTGQTVLEASFRHH
jgi:SAM-dependent methyltransferase